MTRRPAIGGSLLAALAIVLLSGCTPTSDAATATPPPTSSATSTPEPAPTPTADAAPAATCDTVLAAEAYAEARRRRPRPDGGRRRVSAGLEPRMTEAGRRSRAPGRSTQADIG